MNGRLIDLGLLGWTVPGPDRPWGRGPLLAPLIRKAPLGPSPRWFIPGRGWFIPLRRCFYINAVLRIVPWCRKIRFQAGPICK